MESNQMQATSTRAQAQEVDSFGHGCAQKLNCLLLDAVARPRFVRHDGADKYRMHDAGQYLLHHSSLDSGRRK